MSPGKDPTNRFTQWTAAGVSMLNGAFGDYLVRRNNGLAIDMAFMHRGRALAMEKDAFRVAYPATDGRLCIFLHGLCCNEASWEFSDTGGGSGQTYGGLLQMEIGMTPMFVRYNTGLPIAENGKRLAALLDALLGAFPVAIREIVLVGHSMGGLVARSAAAAGGAWLPLLGKMFYLGTPHEGADLAKFAHGTAAALDAMPSRVSRLVSDILDLRSDGIKDLRDGLGSAGAMAEAAQSVRHYLIAGTLADDPDHPVSRLLGDGLVRVPGAADFAGHEQKIRVGIFPGVHHMALAHDMAVYRQIREWMMEKVNT
jgi:pimeloyl-ACP methyl ester carboxylesterase